MKGSIVKVAFTIGRKVNFVTKVGLVDYVDTAAVFVDMLTKSVVIVANVVDIFIKL